MKEKREKIIKKAFGNGKQLRGVLRGNDKLNQLDGLVYSFLNDLKIANKERFLDKYIRVMMSHKLDVRFGLDEMQDKDSFLQFGYSFVNGLLNKEYNNNDKENNNGGKNE
jgi:CRISPR-associated protein Cst1